MKPVLFSYFRSSCSYRCRIALNYKNIEFEYRPVHLINNGGEQFYDDYKILNPMSQVPFLIDMDVQIGQSMAILDYLDLAYPEKPIIPKSLVLRGKSLEIAEIINSGIQPLQNLSVLKYLESDLQLNEEQKLKWIRDFMTKGLQSVQKKMMAGQDFCLGEFSIADILLIPQVYNAIRFEVDLDIFPKIQRVYEHCNNLDFFKKAHPDNQPDSPKG